MTQEVTETVALVGATGAIGNSVATALRQQGRPYRAIGQWDDWMGMRTGDVLPRPAPPVGGL